MINRIIFWVCILFWLFGFSLAQSSTSWGSFWSDPRQVLNNLEKKANPTQQTKLDKVSDVWWSYSSDMKISNTLDSIRENLWPYMQWWVFIWLSLAVIFVIYNWLLLTLSPVKEEWMAKVKKRLMYLIIWIIWITGFSVIIKLVMSMVENIIW